MSGARLNDAQDSFLVPFCYTEKYVDHMMQVCISISGLYTVHTATWNLTFYIIHKGHYSKDFVGFRIVNQRRIPYRRALYANWLNSIFSVYSIAPTGIFSIKESQQ